MTDLRRTPLRRLLLLSALMGGASLVEDTETGNPVAFETDVAKPLVSLIANFLPVQTGSGNPSPDNVRPIVPWNGFTVWSGGRNLCPLGTVTFSRTKKSYIGELPAGTYTISALVTSTDTDNTRCLLRLWKDDSHVGSDIYFTRNTREKRTITIDEPFNYVYMYASDSYVHTEGDTATFADIQIETGSTETSYEPYKTITETDISFPSPVYGGYIDLVTGEVWKTWETVDMGSLRWNWTGTNTTDVCRMSTSSLSGVIEESSSNSVIGKIVCPVYKSISADSTYLKNTGISVGRNKAVIVYDENYNTSTSMDDFTTAVTGKMLAYGLASPVLITTLTLQQITALIGNNTIWSDANGEMTAIYYKKG